MKQDKKLLTQEQWLSRIKRATKDKRLQVKLAALVWWDYCDKMPGGAAKLKLLSQEIDKGEIDPLTLKKLLIKIGYSEAIAEERTRERTYTNKDRMRKKNAEHN